MRVQTRQAYHRCVQRVIEQIIRSPDQFSRLLELSAFAGFPRHHLNRLFGEYTGESLGEFVRRIRLERAAYALRTSPRQIGDLAVEAGYANAEAFTRAFRTAFGVAPSHYRARPTTWRLTCPSGIHWSDEVAVAPFRTAEGKEFGVRIVTRPPLRLAALRYVGEYSGVARAWELLSEVVPVETRRRPELQCLAVYHDDGKSAARRHEPRADVGFTLGPNASPPPGMGVLTIPGGQYAMTRELLGPTEHIAAWHIMNELYVPKRGFRPRNIPGIDEYLSWPLPWSRRRARILIGLEIDLGEP